jgi:hypothetical protein
MDPGQSLDICDTRGRLLAREPIAGRSTVTCDPSVLANGCYVVRLGRVAGRLAVVK